VITQLWLQVQS